MAAAVVLGAAAGAAGKVVSNLQEADAEQRNADYYKEQADFADSVGKREEDVFYTRSTQEMGKQQGAFAAGGVDFSGSALFLAEDQSIRQQKELSAIREMTAQKVLMAKTREEAAQNQADFLSSPGYNILSASGSLLSGAGQYQSVSSPSGGGGGED